MSKTQLYRWFDKDDNLLYVGISYSAVGRAKEHSTTSHWYDLAVKMTLETYSTRQEAMKAEVIAIANENPMHNKARYSSYLLYEEYGFNSADEYIEHRRKMQIKRSKDNDLARKQKARYDMRVNTLINSCEFIEFYHKTWKDILLEHAINEYPRVDWIGAEVSFNKYIKELGVGNTKWFENLQHFDRFRNSRERGKMYTEFKELFVYEDKQHGLFKIWYCDYNAVDTLWNKARILLDLLRQDYKINLAPERNKA